MTPKVRRDDVEPRRQGGHGERPVEVGGGHQAVKQQDARRSRGALRHAREGRAPSGKVDEPPLGQLVREVKIRNIEALDGECGTTGFAEHFAPPPTPGWGRRGGEFGQTCAVRVWTGS